MNQDLSVKIAQEFYLSTKYPQFYGSPTIVTLPGYFRIRTPGGEWIKGILGNY
jgi:hypothetical protein